MAVIEAHLSDAAGSAMMLEHCLRQSHRHLGRSKTL